MDNQHRKIVGYRELDQTEIDLMNEIKEEGKRLYDLHKKVTEFLAARTNEHGTPDYEVGRWAAIGKTELQQGLMALTRAVAAPEFF